MKSEPGWSVWFSDWIFSQAHPFFFVEVLLLWWCIMGRGAGTTDMEELNKATFKTNPPLIQTPLWSTTTRNSYLQLSHSHLSKPSASSIHPSIHHSSSLLPTLSLWSPSSPLLLLKPQLQKLFNSLNSTIHTPPISMPPPGIRCFNLGL